MEKAERLIIDINPQLTTKLVQSVHLPKALSIVLTIYSLSKTIERGLVIDYLV